MKVIQRMESATNEVFNVEFNYLYKKLVFNNDYLLNFHKYNHRINFEGK
jgi:hypothetical protein